jgi:hypothetical protein
MGKDDGVHKMKFNLNNISEFYRWLQEMPLVLSKCNLPPRTLLMTDEEFDDHFLSINNNTIRKEYMKHLNQCTGIIGESINDATAKKAWLIQHTSVRNELIEQARMLRECMAAVRAEVTPKIMAVQRKVELANFQILVSTEPKEKYSLRNLFTEYEDSWELLRTLGQENMNEDDKKYWLLDHSS